MHKRFKRTTILTIFCGALLAGLAVGKNLQLPNQILFLSILFALFAAPKKHLIAIVVIGLCGFSIGMTRADSMQSSLVVYEELYGGTVSVIATSNSDAVYGKSGQLEFDAGSVKIISPQQAMPPGEIKVQGFGANAINRGDEVRITGKMYPTGGSKQAKLNFAQLEVVNKNVSALEYGRKKFVAGMFSAVPEPQASFGLGLLIGQRSTLPDKLLDALSIAGLTHIIAVSGYNLTIIVRIMRRLLGKRSKYQSVVLSFALIGLFVYVTGFSASIVRAAVVSTLSLLAWYYGRSVKPMLILMISAALTAMWNPIYIWSDIGWYLSFFAFFGVLVLAPLVKQRIYGDKPQKLLGQVVLESISAQLMAAPLILFIFGEVSLIALVSNAIIVPLVPIAMLFSLVAGVAGAAVPVVAGYFAVPATLVLTYMLDLVQIFARFPGALISANLKTHEMLYVYGLLVMFTVLLHYAVKQKYGKITDRNIIE